VGHFLANLELHAVLVQHALVAAVEQMFEIVEIRAEMGVLELVVGGLETCPGLPSVQPEDVDHLACLAAPRHELSALAFQYPGTSVESHVAFVAVSRPGC
jgi:hypothetical protein